MTSAFDPTILILEREVILYILHLIDPIILELQQKFHVTFSQWVVAVQRTVTGLFWAGWGKPWDWQQLLAVWRKAVLTQWGGVKSPGDSVLLWLDCSRYTHTYFSQRSICL